MCSSFPKTKKSCGGSERWSYDEMRTLLKYVKSIRCKVLSNIIEVTLTSDKYGFDFEYQEMQLFTWSYKEDWNKRK